MGDEGAACRAPSGVSQDGRALDRRGDALRPEEALPALSDFTVRSLVGGQRMRIQKRGRRWRVEVYDAGKRRCVGTFDTEREAKAAGTRVELEVRTGRGRRTQETVRSWSERWLLLRPRQKESTNAGYREQTKAFVRQYGELRLEDVGVELALEWVRDHQWTHGGLRAMFSDARRAGLLDRNPFTDLRLRRSQGRKNLVVLQRAQVEELARCATEVWDGETGLTIKALVTCAAYLGMRPAELYGLRWSDLDFRNDEVRVERQYSP